MTDPLQQLCNRFRTLTRRALLALGLSRFAGITLVATVVLILTDFVWHFSSVERFLAFFVLLGVVATVVLRDLVVPLRQRWTDREVLHYLDSVLPQSHDLLTNLDELGQPEKVVEAASPEGRAVVDQAVVELKRGLEQLDIGGVVEQQAVRRWQKVALAVLLVCVILGGAAQLATREGYTVIGLQRLLLPWTTVRWPSSTWFVVLSPDGDRSAPEGEDLPIRVEVHGRSPGQVTLIYNPVDETGRFSKREIPLTMFVNPDGIAEYTFDKLSDSIRFRVEGGDGRSDAVTVHVVKRPFLREVIAYYKYPAYTGVPPRITNHAQLSGLEGTEVRLAFTASTPLQQAWIQLAGNAEPINLELDESGTRFEWFHLLADSTSYTLGLLDRHGNREKRAETFRIQVTPDLPPTARLLEPAGDLEVTSRARFRVRYRAEDDYGLRQVRILVSRDGRPAEPIDEKITGPVPQIGKTSAGSFDWDLEKMDLNGVSKLAFFLAAQDVNPTGRGKAESAHLQLTLRSELEVQSNVLLAARALLTEAQLGSNNQRWAWLDAVKWLKSDGKSEADGALLKQFHEEQAQAGRAAVALEGRFRSLSEEMTRNRMEGAFFARRLEQIGFLIHAMSAQIQPRIAKALDEARPATLADDTPTGRVARMKKALTDLESSLKLAALEYQRLYYLLQDWNDLQNVLVTARHLGELQQKVYQTSLKVAPRWIGKEIEDLSEADAKQLATLAQEQATIRDTESALEEELQTLALAAQSQGRKQVFTPLKENLELLRLRSVNDKLIQCAKGIKDNRIDATIQDQLYVLKVFTFVSARLEQAGQDVAELLALDLKTPLVDDRLVEKVATKPPVVGDPASGLVFNPESKVDVEDIGAYKVNTIEQALVFLQSILDDQVLLYTQYTEQKFKEKEQSLRYRQLRLGMLGIRVQRARDASTRVLDFAKDHSFSAVFPYLQSLHADLETTGKLIAEGKIGKETQAFQRELSARVQATRRFLVHRVATLAQLEDRKKSKGLDEFGQRYVVVDANLATLAQMREQLSWAAVLQMDVHSKTERLLSSQDSRVLANAATVAAFARTRETRVVELVQEVLSAAKKISGDDLVSRVRKELALLRPQAFDSALAALMEAKLPAGLPAMQAQLLETLRGVLGSLDALADERIRPKEALAKEVIEAQKAIGQVDLKKSPEVIAREIATAREKALHDFQFDVIADKIKKSSLSPQVQTYLLQTLATNPDPQYRSMISAYFNRLLPPDKEKP